MINLGLKRITRLLHRIAQARFQQLHFDPPWKAVHIAGTNGKGSVAAYLSALLRRQGQREDGKPLRVGRFTSPHSIDRWDCIRIDDKPIAEDVFLQTETDVRALATCVEEELRIEAREDPTTNHHGNGPSIEQIEKDAKPTEFEILTATAFTIFSQPESGPCDIAVIECGLGGRLDATNALPDSAIVVSVITSIGLDHLDMLGGSLESIIKEKCGIVRKDVPVVIDYDCHALKREILERFEDKTVESNKEVLDTFDAKDYWKLLALEDDLDDEHHLVHERKSSFSLMPHQRSNFSLALAAFWSTYEGKIQHRKTPNYKDDIKLWRNVLRDAAKSYPARLQLLQPGWLDDTDKGEHFPLLNHTDVLLDGAHNAQSSEVLRAYVDKKVLTDGRGGRHTIRPEIWIIALSSTKPPTEILTTLFPRQISAPYTSLDDRKAYSQPPSETTKIIFASFGTVDGMPWVKPASVEALRQCADSLGLSPNVAAIAGNIVEALAAAEKILAGWKEEDSETKNEEPLVIVGGSLYLCSDFLRFVRDGREAFLRHLEVASVKS